MKNTPPPPLLKYEDHIKALDDVVRHCIAVSQACAGIPAPTGAHYYASVLFTSLCTRGVSLLTLLPRSPLVPKSLEQWDYSSCAGLVRSILEVRLAFFYLCAEEVSADEWNCRWNLFNLHDCTSRISLFQDMPGEAGEITGFQAQAEELKDRLRANAFFVGLSQKSQNKLINGHSAYHLPLEEIAARAGVELKVFRWLYRLFSSQVHGLPLAFYRMGEQNRGQGVYSETEESYTKLCIAFAISLFAHASDEMKVLFPSANDGRFQILSSTLAWQSVRG
ncbi:MAG: hypothetical protein EKK52_09775 [Burkholderiales bacterium]|uniref:DUF5677 domain-containing protein n=1 Tax=Roseateles sp. TaxID=1971397 RepID=UPI000F9D4CBC|nr:MAG: hypothetical protein EKK52_09775 [Burkholderiales bacterium]